ncbi:MAG: threonylcarbamoyl-AMP synthase [Clostridiales bacterium]|nr:threonylcarbamoyl-AMP synthase [Clostridiales bacterium]
MERIKKYEITKLIKGTDDEELKDSAKHLREGELVGFPTETVYGLGGNAFDASSVDKIYEAKGRPSDNPLIVHIYDKSQIAELTSEITPNAQKLIDAFMPGPITVIMKKSSKIPDNVTAGLDTVGVRMPSNEVANKFLRYCEVPVAAPSANLSGSPSPTKASHVYNDMNGYIYSVIDGGESDVGLESTVVDAAGEEPVVLRPGAVTKKMIEDVCRKKTSSHTSVDKGETPKAPGMKYRHYAPSAEVMVIDYPSDVTVTDDDSEDNRRAMFEIAKPYIMKAQEILKNEPFSRIGIFCGSEVRDLFEKLGDNVLLSHIEFYIYGKSSDTKAASHHLFDGLRLLDIQKVEVILAPGFSGEDIEEAYMNRLLKAAGKKGEDVSSSSFSKTGEKHVFNADLGATLSVLFVCSKNRNLSVAAEGIFKKLINEEGPFCLSDDNSLEAEIYSESCGIYAADGEDADPKMITALKNAGISMSHHKTTRASASVYDRNDIIVAMKDEQAVEILKSFPELEGRVFSLSSYLASKGLVMKDDKGRVISLAIPDPEGENDLTYEHTVKALEAWLKILFPYILKDLGAMRI